MYKKKVKSYISFRCKTNSLAKEKCTPHSIPYSKLVECITEKVREYIGNYIDSESLTNLSEIHSSVFSKKKVLLLESKKINEKLQKREQALKTLYMDRVNGIITVEQFNNLNQSFETENKELKERLTELENKLEVLNDHDVLKEQLQGIIQKYEDFKELTYEMVQQLIDTIEIKEKNKKTEEQEIIIHWLF